MTGFRMRRERGFTLIEVMVAMLVVALALPALLDQAERLSNHTFAARDRTQAYWVAQNIMTELKLEQRLNGKLPDRKDSDTVELGRQRWSWTMTSEETAVPGMLRVEIRVTHAGDDNSLAYLSGFIHDA